MTEPHFSSETPAIESEIEPLVESPAEPEISAEIEADTAESGADEGEKERVAKLISRAGIASRRAAETLILEGRVSVNGHFIQEPGVKADPFHDKIVVDGKPLAIKDKPATVILLHKPKYTITSRSDEGKVGDKRTTVLDLLPKKFASFHPVGRLDYETTGVLLLTDDGELTHLLTHPSHGVEKVYEARVRGEVTASDIETLRNGVYLEDGKTAPAGAKVLAQTEKNALVQITLKEGKNRQVRRMLEALGHPVTSLRRIQFAGIKLEGMPSGAHRVLLPAEVKSLFRVAQQGLKEAKRKPRKPRVSRGEIKVPAPTKAKNLRIGEARARALGKKPETPTETREARPTRPTRGPQKPTRQAATAKRVERRWKD